MNRTYRVWYILALLVALAPPAVRLLQWQQTHTEPVDPAMASAGNTLFNRDSKPKDSMCTAGDGLGPVYNATSCTTCHKLGGVGGAGGVEHNVTNFTVKLPGQKPREGVIHAMHIDGKAETLHDIHPELPAITRPTLEQLVLTPGKEGNHLRLPAGVTISQRNTPAVFGSKLIDDIPERAILANAKAQRMRWGMAPPDDESVPVGRALRLANGRVGRFGWKAQMSNLSDFVQAACANELGLGNPGQAQPTPLYLQASLSLSPRSAAGYDLTTKQCDELTAFCASLPKPVQRLPQGVTEDQAATGSKLFTKVGCAECHSPNLGGVDGIYSDLLLHPMGRDLVGGGSYGEPPVPPTPDTPDGGPSPSEWRTPPLWGVAQSGPYMHDGRANSLEEAIKMHGGQGARSAKAFGGLSYSDQVALVAFLKTLQAP